MALSNPFGDYARSKLERPDYVGVVVDNNDPEKRQRVRIRVAQLHRNVPDDQLPWAMPSNNGAQANAGSGVGTVNVPPVGSKMSYQLTDNDPHNPRMGGSVTTDDANSENELLQEDYPHTVGSVDQAGNLTKVNTKKGTITTTHVSGASIHIDAGGNISLFSPGKLTLAANGGVDIVGGGTVNVHGGTVDLKGGRIDLNGSGSALSPSASGARTAPVIKSPSGQVSL